MGGLPKRVSVAMGPPLLGTCPHIAQAACSGGTWLENDSYGLGLAHGITEQKRTCGTLHTLRRCRYLDPAECMT